MEIKKLYMTCAETLLRESSGRNVPNMTKEEIEKTLCDYLGCTKVLWIPEGIYNDETNGHIDNICNSDYKKNLIYSNSNPNFNKIIKNDSDSFKIDLQEIIKEVENDNSNKI